jgi:cytochrome c oxidase assembly factor CtaG
VTAGTLYLVPIFLHAAGVMTVDALYAKNTVLLFGHTMANLSMYVTAGLVYAALPLFTRRAWPTTWAVVIAWVIVTEVVYVALWARGGLGPRRSHLGWGRLVAFTAGLVVIVVALMSPIGANDERCLSLHMVSHDLLIWIAAPLLLVGGVPVLRDTHRFPHALQRAVAILTNPVVALTISTALLWMWHRRAAYGLALESQVVHGVEHLCFLVGYLIYWWPLVVPPWEVGWLRGNTARALYLLAGMMQSSLLGALITFHGTVLYTEYLQAPGATPASALADQRLAGAIMWFPGAVVFASAAILVIRNRTPQAVQST